MGVWVVVGGQYGSEGKGKVAATIAIEERIDVCIRCGGPNSGHSVGLPSGGDLVLRQLPTGVLRPGSRLLIAAGAVVDLDVLRRELDMLGLGQDRVGVDRNCVVIEGRDRDTERAAGLRERLSSTLCGVGAAVARRVLRGPDVVLAGAAAERERWLRPFITGVAGEASAAASAGRSVLVEGTQGFGLSLYHTASYPHATSRDTTAAAFLSEAGIGPTLVTNVVLVLRTFPIRVAGAQAGPLEQEITWDQLRAESGAPGPLEETTTVTKMTRRVGRFEWPVVEAAACSNAPTEIAINGLDYLDYRNRGARRWEDLTPAARDFVARVERRLGAPVTRLGTGPELGCGLTRAGGAHAGRGLVALPA